MFFNFLKRFRGRGLASQRTPTGRSTGASMQAFAPKSTEFRGVEGYQNPGNPHFEA
jgi:hypothetical protein